MHDDGLRQAKKEIRKRVLAARLETEAPAAAAKSRLIIDNLNTLEPLASARVIMGYAPFRGEVDVMPWLLERLRSGVKVLLPRVVAATGELEAVPLELDERMAVSAMGINEPVGDGVDPREIDAVIVPGVVFDRNGYRLGYGKGFYDRFLPRLRREAFICAVAFELQVVDEVPHEEHDYRLGCLVTEKGVQVMR